MLNATVIKRIEVTPELVIFHIKPDEPFKAFHPGQYVAIGLPGSSPRPEHFPAEPVDQSGHKLIKRAYSIGSAPDAEYLEFYVAIVPEGALTSRLVLVNEGDRIYAAPKITGTFTITEVPADHNLILVSTGTGLAPYLSMIRTPSAWTENRHITIVHGVRYAHDLGYSDELKAFSAARPNFRYIPIVSRAARSELAGNGGSTVTWEGETGRVQRLFEDGTVPLNPESDHVFLCGNPAMIDDMEKLLLEKGFTVHSKKAPGNIHLEKYW